MIRKRISLVLLLCLVASCGGEQDNQATTDHPPVPLPGVYSGVFPCDGCDGIPTTLWLRSDGRFFFRQTYPSSTATAADAVYSLGRWNLSTDYQTVELHGSGPVRAFSHPEGDVLVMRKVSDQEYRLTRDPQAAQFFASIRMSGTMQIHGSDATFTECLTGLEAPVSKDGDFARFWRQIRSIGRLSEPVYVELEGRFVWAGDGTPQSMSIQRFVTIRADAAC